MYEIFFDGEVIYATTTDELSELYKKAQTENLSIEAYNRETGELILFWFCLNIVG